MSSFNWDIDDTEKLRNGVKACMDKYGHSSSQVISFIQEFVKKGLKNTFENLPNNSNLKRIVEKNISDNFVSFAYLKVFDLHQGVPKKKDSLGSFDAIENLINYKTKRPGHNLLDLYGVYLGYAGIKGYLNDISLAECFQIEFLEINIENELIPLLYPFDEREVIKNKYENLKLIPDIVHEISQINKKIDNHQESLGNKKMSRDYLFGNEVIKQLNKITTQINIIRENNSNETIRELEIQIDNIHDKINGKTSIPHYKKSPWLKWIWGRIRMLFGKRKWLYYFKNGNAPLGLSWEYLSQETTGYISADFQLDNTSHDPNKKDESDVLNHLYTQLFKKKGRISKFVFILAGSGTGKTSLLLNLYLKAKKHNASKRIFILPFSEREKLPELNEAYENDILILDGLDEDFEIRKINENSNKIAEEIFEQTKKFGHVLISSRNQFFRKNKVIAKFIEKITLGNEPYDYQTIFLCSFSEEQIKKFLKQKFSVEQVSKAKQVIRYIGKDILHRQLLIANVDKLFPVLDNPDKIKEAKSYYLFDALVKNWNAIEQGKVRSKVKKIDDDRVKAFEHTFSFCKVLAENLLRQNRDSYQGFLFEEIEEQLATNDIEKGKLLTNRTFLILDINNRYRFAHQSIYEFFIAINAYKDQKFHNDYFKDKKHDLIFGEQIYEEKIFHEFHRVNKILIQEKIDHIVNISSSIEDFKLYADDVKFEPYFKLRKDKLGKIRRVDFFENQPKWNRFSTFLQIGYYWDYNNFFLTRNSKSFFIKFFQKKDFDEEYFYNREKAYNIISELLRFINLIGIEIPSSNQIEIPNYTGKHPMFLSLRDNQLDLNINKISFNPIDVVINKNNSIKIFGTYNLRIKDYIPTGTFCNLIINFSEDLFSILLSRSLNIKNELLIYISEKQLKSINLKMLMKLIVFSKELSFQVIFFTKENILINSRILHNQIRYYDSYFSLKQSIQIFSKNFFFKYYHRGGLNLSKGWYFDSLPDELYNFSHPLINLSLDDLIIYIGNQIDYEKFFLTEDLNEIYNKIVAIHGLKRIDLILKLLKKVINCHTLIFSEFITEESSFDGNEKIKVKNLVFNNINFEKLLPYLSKTNIESILLWRNAISFDNDQLRGMSNLKELYIIDVKNIRVDFSNYSNKLKSLVIKSHKISQKNLSIENLKFLFKVSSLNNVTIDVPVFLSLYRTNMLINNTLKTLRINADYIPFFEKNFSFKELRYLKVSFSIKKEIDTINFSFLNNFPKVRKLFILHSYQFFENISEMRGKTFEELLLTFNYPSNEKDMIYLKEVFEELNKVNASVIYIRFFNYNCENKNKIEEVFDCLDILNNKISFILFTNNPSHTIKKNKLKLMYFDFKYVRKHGRLELITNEEFKSKEVHLAMLDLNRNISNRAIIFMNALFYDIFSELNSRYNLLNFSVRSLKVPISIIQNRVLNIYNPEKSLFSERYNYGCFVNTNYEIIQNPLFLLFLLDIKQVRLINIKLDINNPLEFLVRQGEVEKISVSSLIEVPTYIDKYGVTKAAFFVNRLQEIEILSDYLDTSEKQRLSQYIKEMRDIGVKVTIRKMPFKVKYSEPEILFYTEIEES